MKRALKIALRSLYILPALGVLFGGDVLSHEVAPGGEGLFGPKKAEADIPYSQGSYYAESSYQGSGDGSGAGYGYTYAGDCPSPASPSPSGGACC